jgi:hypothetical protein
MKRSLAVFTAPFLLLALASAANQPANSQAAISQVLNKQVEAWNQQDLEGFMQGYWHSPELTFFSGATVHRGWDAALERYRKAYQSEGRQMGKLAFSDLQIEPLGPRPPSCVEASISPCRTESSRTAGLRWCSASSPRAGASFTTTPAPRSRWGADYLRRRPNQLSETTMELPGLWGSYLTEVGRPRRQECRFTNWRR